MLLCEASHGTSEYYTWRTEISKRLIEEQAFTFIAVEGDWPDCYRITRRYDAFIYIDETHALDPLHMPVAVTSEMPETYPTGM